MLFVQALDRHVLSFSAGNAAQERRFVVLGSGGVRPHESITEKTCEHIDVRVYHGVTPSIFQIPHSIFIHQDFPPFLSVDGKLPSFEILPPKLPDELRRTTIAANFPQRSNAILVFSAF